MSDRDKTIPHEAAVRSLISSMAGGGGGGEGGAAIESVMMGLGPLFLEVDEGTPPQGEQWEPIFGVDGALWNPMAGEESEQYNTLPSWCDIETGECQPGHYIVMVEAFADKFNAQIRMMVPGPAFTSGNWHSVEDDIEGDGSIFHTVMNLLLLTPEAFVPTFKARNLSAEDDITINNAYAVLIKLS